MFSQLPLCAFSVLNLQNCPVMVWVFRSAEIDNSEVNAVLEVVTEESTAAEVSGISIYLFNKLLFILNFD